MQLGGWPADLREYYKAAMFAQERNFVETLDSECSVGKEAGLLYRKSFTPGLCEFVLRCCGWNFHIIWWNFPVTVNL